MATPKNPVWELEPHTAAKHEILRRYLGAWFPILAGYNGRVVFLDGFAGPGIYSGGEPGSPLIALTTLLDHAAFGRMQGTEFLFIFVEKDKKRADSLGEALDRLWYERGGQPKNVKVELVGDEFAEVAGDIVATLREQKKRLAPTFAFIDPFGWSGVPLELICDLLSYERCEVFFNFMYDSLNRFITHTDPKIQAHLRDLFGTEEYRDAAGLTPAKRKQFLHDLYSRQLRELGNFGYVHSFEMINDGGHTVYSLFFGTRHIKGVEVMKQAMWAVDPVKGLRFSDQTMKAGLVLFEEEPDVGPLRDAILERFAGRGECSVEEVEEFVLLETAFAKTHYKKLVLKDLQNEGRLEPTHGQRNRGTFPPGTRFVID